MIIKDIPENTTKLQKPCNECPYSKTIIPGATGGSDPSVYVGQGQGNFWLPCHKNCDFSDKNWKSDVSVQQCAGAAIYRANIEAKINKTLHHLSKSDVCFESPEELYAHHKQISLEEAREFLSKNTPEMLLNKEMIKVLAKL